jgi:hypothetical protein
MRTLVRRLVVTSLLLTAITLALQSPSHGDTECQQTDTTTGKCLLWVETSGDSGNHAQPANDGPEDTGPGAACYWDGTDQGITKPPPGPVPCTSEGGYWSNAHNCYISPQKPQPPADDPAWQGHEPGKGAIYQCYQPQTGLLISIWAADPPADSGGGPTPREVAQIAIESMALKAIDIGITPEPGPDSIGLVGMPVWMWAKDPGSDTYGPATASASAGGITVTATARVHELTWDMGDGIEVVCRTAGTPYEASFGKRESPDCGHVYEESSAHQPGGRYTVTATSDWVITWSGAGQTGTIRLNGLSRSVEIAVGEAQVLVQ